MSGTCTRPTRLIVGSRIASAILTDMRRARARANGEGTAYQATWRTGKPWCAVLVVGWTLDGRPIRRSRYASSEQAAKDLLRSMRQARETGYALPDDHLTVSKWLQRWVPAQAVRVRPATMRHYRFMADRYILPALGGIPLQALRASQVDAMMDAIPNANTASGARALLSRALRDAQRDRLVTENVATLARPRRKGARRQAPDPAMVRDVLAALTGHRLYELYVLAAATGLRMGEVCGLRWSDWSGERLRIALQLIYTRDPAEPFILAEPKTPGSVATIILPELAQRALARQKVRQAEERMAHGATWRNVNDLIFTTTTGDPLPPSTVDYVLRQAGRLSMHDLRRFAATVVAATGDMKAAQALLRHRSAALTADVYASETDAGRRRAAAALQEALG